MSERHAFRAKWHDYNAGIYFITICSHNLQHIFGTITGGRFYPTELGSLVAAHLALLPDWHADTELWNYVVMPNHIHFVLAVRTGCPFVVSSGENKRHPGCLKPPMHGDEAEDYHHNSRLAMIIGAFKAGVSRVSRAELNLREPCWHSRFHEHIIRNQRSLENIMTYIDNNVLNWDKDCYY
jgi:hypothetical protein